MTLVEPMPRRPRDRRVGTLTGYILLHLNLMFSSIEEAQRPEVVRRCYEPLLDLAEDGIPVAIEASGLTLEIVQDLAPGWIARLKKLIADGRVEFVGSGYAQAIGPLMPWPVVARNLALGRAVYRKLLGANPRIALVNEQAYSAGIVPLYRADGYDAVVMDWDDPASHHAEWNRHWRYHPQRAAGVDGTEIGLLWSNTIAFQKLQRLAHGDISLDDYADFVLSHRGPVDRVFAIYTNDAECFDFRPGRFATETVTTHGEWKAIGAAFEALRQRGVTLAFPSDALKAASGANAGHLLALEAPNNPVPVKKQPKYNLTRWAASGRDDLWANAQCHRAAQLLSAANAGDDAWRTLCRLWSSDFRTHITEKRWTGFVEELAEFVARLSDPPPHSGGPPKAVEGADAAPDLSLFRGRAAGLAPLRAASAPSTAARSPSPAPLRSAGEDQAPRIECGERLILVETGALRLALDKRRGLALSAFGRPNARALAGFLPHGSVDDIALSADWYTGNTVFEGPGEPKVTDLEPCTPEIAVDPGSGAVTISGQIRTPLGPIDKTIRIPPDDTRIETELTLHWPNWGKGSLRLAHVTLLPGAFDVPALAYATHNGGRTPERFPLQNQEVDLGAPVSFLVSCRSGVGMTEGWLELGDGANAIRLEADLSGAAVIGLVEHKIVHGLVFCRMMLSALEMDETRRPAATPSAPRRLRYALSLRRVNAC
ncbi:MAG: glycoside hydrolase family 57 [Alphaproteobacteria bacterium]|nr:glycoside hydrolase family 57 [Alphaproteobacteria bacterium]